MQAEYTGYDKEVSDTTIPWMTCTLTDDCIGEVTDTTYVTQFPCPILLTNEKSKKQQKLGCVSMDPLKKLACFTDNVLLAEWLAFWTSTQSTRVQFPV